MRKAGSGHHTKRWFDGHSPQEHIRDGLQLLARVVMLVVSMACW